MQRHTHTTMLTLAISLAACTEAAPADMPRLAACEEQAAAWCGSDSGACARVWTDQWCDPPHWTDPVPMGAQDACLDAIADRSPGAGVPAACWRTWVRQDGFSDGSRARETHPFGFEETIRFFDPFLRPISARVSGA